MKANIRKVTVTFTSYISYPDGVNYSDMDSREFVKLAEARYKDSEGEYDFYTEYVGTEDVDEIDLEPNKSYKYYRSEHSGF
jgi:hypothetical protein